MIINWGIPWYSSFSDLKSLVDRDRFFQVESIEPASCLLLLSRYFNAMSKVGKAMGPPKMGGEHPPGWGRLLNACYEWSYLYNYWSWQAAWFIGIMIDNLWWEYAPIFVRPSVPVDVFFFFPGDFSWPLAGHWGPRGGSPGVHWGCHSMHLRCTAAQWEPPYLCRGGHAKYGATGHQKWDRFNLRCT